MKQVTIYTDGACSGNPGPGGWGAILEYNGVEKELSGGADETTNNRMELTAVIEALSALREPCRVSLYTDSKYIVDGINEGWAVKWRENSWMRNKKEKALNPELWERLLDLIATHEVTFIWVKGHASNEKNNRCDQLAVLKSKEYTQ
ncbi:MAG: ribonuclease HI [Oscillospiraceae bacterium]|nr:ribonuclease HI [Oscillospiraceae bacterium]